MSMPPLSTMKKEELRNELDEAGIEYSSRETVPELRERLKAHREEQKLFGEDPPAPKVTGLHSMNKAELTKLMGEHGLTVTPNTSRDQMITALRNLFYLAETPKATDKLLIGKHHGSTYYTILTEDPGYYEWACKAVLDAGSSADLKRFVKWAKMFHENPEKLPVKKEVNKTPSISVKRESKEKDEVADLKKQIEEMKQRMEAVTAKGEKRSVPSNSKSMEVDNNPDMTKFEGMMMEMVSKIKELEGRLNQNASSSASMASWEKAGQ